MDSARGADFGKVAFFESFEKHGFAHVRPGADVEDFAVFIQHGYVFDKMVAFVRVRSLFIAKANFQSPFGYGVKRYVAEFRFGKVFRVERFVDGLPDGEKRVLPRTARRADEGFRERLEGRSGFDPLSLFPESGTVEVRTFCAGVFFHEESIRIFPKIPKPRTRFDFPGFRI